VHGKNQLVKTHAATPGIRSSPVDSISRAWSASESRKKRGCREDSAAPAFYEPHHVEGIPISPIMLAWAKPQPIASNASTRSGKSLAAILKLV